MAQHSAWQKLVWLCLNNTTVNVHIVYSFKLRTKSAILYVRAGHQLNSYSKQTDGTLSPLTAVQCICCLLVSSVNHAATGQGAQELWTAGRRRGGPAPTSRGLSCTIYHLLKYTGTTGWFFFKVLSFLHRQVSYSDVFLHYAS